MATENRRVLRHDVLVALIRIARRRQAARTAARIRLMRAGTRWVR